MDSIKKIAVIGAGTMGHGIAMVFAMGNYQVTLYDLTQDILDKARDLISANLQTLIAVNQLDSSMKGEVLDERITYVTDLSVAAEDADFVIEAVTENPDIKKGLFARLDVLTQPHAILASNTSHLDIFNLVESDRLERYIITHWFAPPHIIPLVEIVVGPKTNAQVLDTVKDMHDGLGKTTIVLKKFLPGFIGNRLQGAIGLEMWHLLDNGYVTVEDLDKAVKAGFGLRTPLWGVLQRLDFTGLDIVKQALGNKSYRPPEVRGYSNILNETVSKNHLGVKTGKGFYDYHGMDQTEIMRERDIKLLKLIKFIENLDVIHNF
jgi:3-hydroxybutyryl-CoA dehydrogenase